jgi:hypothetical protein
VISDLTEKYVESDSDDEALGPIVPFSKKPPPEEEAYDSDQDPDWAPFAMVCMIQTRTIRHGMYDSDGDPDWAPFAVVV